MAYIITEPCIATKDTGCADACPVDCIHPTKDEPDFEAVEMLYIDPDTCIDCNLCVDACPVNAIYAEDDLPNEWKKYVQIKFIYDKIPPMHNNKLIMTNEKSRPLMLWIEPHAFTVEIPPGDSYQIYADSEIDGALQLITEENQKFDFTLWCWNGCLISIYCDDVPIYDSGIRFPLLKNKNDNTNESSWFNIKSFLDRLFRDNN